MKMLAIVHYVVSRRETNRWIYDIVITEYIQSILTWTQNINKFTTNVIFFIFFFITIFVWEIIGSASLLHILFKKQKIQRSLLLWRETTKQIALLLVYVVQKTISWTKHAQKCSTFLYDDYLNNPFLSNDWRSLKLCIVIHDDSKTYNN